MSAPAVVGSGFVMATSLASNVEATLAFTLASKLVDMMLALQQGSSSSSSGTVGTAWILGAMCLMIISVSGSWTEDRNKKPSSSSAGNDLASMLNQMLVLAFSRIVLLQVFFVYFVELYSALDV